MAQQTNSQPRGVQVIFSKHRKGTRKFSGASQNEHLKPRHICCIYNEFDLKAELTQPRSMVKTEIMVHCKTVSEANSFLTIVQESSTCWKKCQVLCAMNQNPWVSSCIISTRYTKVRESSPGLQTYERSYLRHLYRIQQDLWWTNSQSNWSHLSIAEVWLKPLPEVCWRLAEPGHGKLSQTKETQHIICIQVHMTQLWSENQDWRHHIVNKSSPVLRLQRPTHKARIIPITAAGHPECLQCSADMKQTPAKMTIWHTYRI